MKIAVYTAIFGEKDLLRDPINYQEVGNIDYFLFTDNPLIESKIYKKLNKPILFKDITKNARYYKILGAPELEEYDFTIWHDGNLQFFHDSVYKLVDFIKNGFIGTFMHPNRKCAYEESIACIKREKDNPKKIFNQIYGYYKLGMPSENGLFETSILIRNNKSTLNKFLAFWWDELEKRTRRDQISLAFLTWKYNFPVEIIPGSREMNSYSKFSPHSYQEYSVDGIIPKQYSKGIKVIFILLVKFLKFSGVIRFWIISKISLNRINN